MIALSAITPSGSFTLSPDLIITLNGADIKRDAVVFFDGLALKTNFISAKKLTAIIPKSSLQVAGIYQVWIQQNSLGDVSANLPFNLTTKASQK